MEPGGGDAGDKGAALLGMDSLLGPSVCRDQELLAGLGHKSQWRRMSCWAPGGAAGLEQGREGRRKRPFLGLEQGPIEPVGEGSGQKL